MHKLLSDILSIGITASIALATGLVFRWLGLPAPFLIGSLFGVWFSGAAIAPLRTRLGIARWLYLPVALGLGTLIGANFRPDVLAHINAAAATVSAMAAATILATLVGLAYLMRVRHYDFTTAILSCIPGGQAEVVMMSRDLIDKDYVVALFHLVRVAIVFCSTPLLLALIEGDAAVAASNATLLGMPSLTTINLETLLVFLAVSVISLPVAQRLQIPMPHLIGPLLASSALHIAGLIEIPRISEFVILAQITIGSSVGARLAKVPFIELAGYLIDAVVNAVIILTTYGAMAFCIASLTGLDFVNMLLAFVPGGLYEVTLLALIFGFDVAFVAFHHTIRVMLIFLSLPFIVGLATRQKPVTDAEKP
ncbi:MAG: AbrB family transcriptional regulator [Candidatus Puniceispirillum sp.]|jgi:membrane AbrB-like protein